ncbi:GroES-like protein [Peniophora sp. CONT]|nr:GroES-like protein [Peniophora sp. CONT]
MSVPSTQTALLVHEKGAPFTLGSRPVPTLQAGQVLIRNVAAGLNIVDAYIQKIGLLVDKWPAVAGREGAGDIAAIGEGVTNFAIGDRVFYQSGAGTSDGAAYQEYTLADAARVGKIPPNLTYEQAATVPLCLATAAIGMYKSKSSQVLPNGFDVGGAGLTPPWAEGSMGKYKGQAAVVFRGSSSVGQFAIRLAKLSGFSPIITTASKSNEEYCLAAGATHVIDYHDVPYPVIPATILTIAGKTPITLSYEAVGSDESQKAAWSVLSPGGTLVTPAGMASRLVGTQGEDDEEGKRFVRAFGGVNAPFHQAFGTEMYVSLSDMLEKGLLSPTKLEVIEGGLSGVDAGLARIAAGVSGVKLVVRVRASH